MSFRIRRIFRALASAIERSSATRLDSDVDSRLQLDGCGIARLQVIVVGVGAHHGHAERRHLIQRLFHARLPPVDDVGLIVVNVIAVEAVRIAAQRQDRSPRAAQTRLV